MKTEICNQAADLVLQSSHSQTSSSNQAIHTPRPPIKPSTRLLLQSSHPHASSSNQAIHPLLPPNKPSLLPQITAIHLPSLVDVSRKIWRQTLLEAEENSIADSNTLRARTTGFSLHAQKSRLPGRFLPNGAVSRGTNSWATSFGHMNSSLISTTSLHFSFTFIVAGLQFLFSVHIWHSCSASTASLCFHFFPFLVDLRTLSLPPNLFSGTVCGVGNPPPR
ncbi:hypothetical protein E2P81_ATG01714 [Venturia nashicola]|nr:hypothetical protein E2P81_ATG01714 [Venturia nashicola]